MNYHDLTTAFSVSNHARSVMGTIYEDVILEEATHLKTVSEKEQDAFRKAGRTVFGYDTGRSWGTSWFNSSHITDVEFDSFEAKISFEKADYVRSCYMGQICDSMAFPASLVEAYLIDDDTAYRAALIDFVENQVKMVEAHIVREIQKAHDAAETARIKAEEDDLREYERLRVKFGGQS